MFKKLCFLTSFVLVLSLASSTYALVQSDWEQTWDGWVRQDSTREIGPVYDIGATLHDYCFKVEIQQGWIQAVRLPMNTEPNLSIVLNNNLVAFNVTWVTADWPEAAADWVLFERIVINGEGIGWNDIFAGPDCEYCTDDGNPGWPGGWDTTNWGASHTRQMTFSYGQIDFSGLPAEPGWLDFILCLHSGEHAYGTFYFDNFRFFNTAYAYLPKPYDTQTGDPITTDLSWTAGDYAQYHDIYFGTNENEVAIMEADDPDPNDVYRARQDIGLEIYNIPETLEIGKTYYWRVDEVNDTCAPNLWKGEVWSFTTQSKAREPYPTHGAIEVERDLVFSWVPGFEGAEHDVYLGTSFAEVNEADNGDPMGPTEVYRGRQNADANTYPVPQLLDMEQTYFWRIDEVNDTCSLLFEGDVWRFTTLSGSAKAPYPFDGAEGIYFNAIKLIWTAGPYAADSLGHDVYFGTDYNDVLNANDNDTTGIFRGNQTATEYPLSNLDLNTTYYWRIDEVNTSHPDVNWPGNLWSFALSDYITIDDFEYYTVSDPEGDAACPYYDSNDLRLDKGNDMRFWWLDGHVQKNPQGDCGSTTASYNPLALEGTVGRLPGSRIIRAEGQTGFGMSYYYDNNDVTNSDFPPEQAATENKYSEVLRYYTNAVDLTPSQVNANMAALELSYRGSFGNAADPVYDRMYIGLRDTNNKYAYVDNPDPDAARSGTWQQWAVKLSDFTDKEPTLNLNSIRSVRIGFGKQGNKYNVPLEEQGGEGTVIFDNIRLYGPHCVLSERSSSFAAVDFGPAPAGDCVINYQEIAIIGDDWLAEDAIIETDDPCDIGLVAYYPMNEDSGTTIADDTGDPCHEGTFSAEGVSWVTPGVAGGSCIHMAGDGSSPGARITIGDWNPSEGTGQLTLSVWVRWTGPRDPAGGQPQGLISKRGGWSEETVMFIFEMDTPDAEGLRGSFAFRQFSDAIWSEGGIMYAFMGQWAHLAATFDGTTTETAARLYLNGQEVASGPFTFGGGSGEGIDMVIGNNNDSSWEGCPGVFNGEMDEVRIYNRALSASEIAYLADYATNPEDGVLYVPVPSRAELYEGEPQGQRIVNFRDFAILAETWLEEDMWP